MLIDHAMQDNSMNDEYAAMGYDIIGDVHGCADALKLLLDKLGYQQDSHGVFRYQGKGQRQLIFLGDLVDRGPQIRETLQIVKSAVDAKVAHVVLGNHEFSAIAYFTPVDGGFLRAHTLRAEEQIKQTLEQFKGYESQWQEYLQWFKTLPLFLEFNDFRIVHACWDHNAIADYQKAFSSHCISDARIKECEDVQSLAYKVIDRLTRGISLHLPDGKKLMGRDGYLRHNFRVNFWSENANVYDDVHFQPDLLPDPLGRRPLSDEERQKICHYGRHEKPLFIGHYWLEGEPAPVAENIACLDYSAVHNGQLVAYRFNAGDQTLEKNQFLAVSSNDLPSGSVNG